jgi:hypothetical protein
MAPPEAASTISDSTSTSGSATVVAKPNANATNTINPS